MKTKKLDYILTVLGVLLFVGSLVLLKIVPEPQGLMVALPYICIGIGCGLLGRGISVIVSQNMMEKYPEIRKQKCIQEQDERNVFLSTTAAAKAYRTGSDFDADGWLLVCGWIWDLLPYKVGKRIVKIIKTP